MSDDSGLPGGDSFDAPWFDGVESDASAGAPGRTAAAGRVGRSTFVGGAFGLLVVALVVDLLLPAGLPGLGNSPTALEWLLAFGGLSTLVTASYAFEAIPDRSELTATFRRRPVAAASLGYVVLFVLGGSIGVLLVGQPEHNMAAVYQPPLFTTADVTRVPTCLGEVVDYRCHGSLAYPLGSGPHGQSMTVLALHGASVALKLAVVVLGLVVPVATLVGVTAGFYGGTVEDLLVRTIEVVETLPAVLVYIVAAYVFGHSLVLIAVVFSLFSWAGAARIVRSESRRIRGESFVQSARSAGASDRFIVRQHVLPNVADTVVVAAFRAVPALVLAEASLSFLGLSDTDLLSWGRFIVDGIGPYFPDRFWLWGVPAAALVLTVVALDVVGDTLREATQRAE